MKISEVLGGGQLLLSMINKLIDRKQLWYLDSDAKYKNVLSTRSASLRGSGNGGRPSDFVVLRLQDPELSYRFTERFILKDNLHIWTIVRTQVDDKQVFALCRKDQIAESLDATEMLVSLSTKLAEKGKLWIEFSGEVCHVESISWGRGGAAVKLSEKTHGGTSTIIIPSSVAKKYSIKKDAEGRHIFSSSTRVIESTDEPLVVSMFKKLLDAGERIYFRNRAGKLTQIRHVMGGMTARGKPAWWFFDSTNHATRKAVVWKTGDAIDKLSLQRQRDFWVLYDKTVKLREGVDEPMVVSMTRKLLAAGTPVYHSTAGGKLTQIKFVTDGSVPGEKAWYFNAANRHFASAGAAVIWRTEKNIDTLKLTKKTVGDTGFWVLHSTGVKV